MRRKLAPPVGALGALLLGAALVPAAVAPGAVHAAAPPAPECVARTTPVPQGPARLVKDMVVPKHNGRLHDLTLYSPAVAADVHVDVLLPAHYAAARTKRFHTVYLLHGSGGHYSDWVDNGVQGLLVKHRRADHVPPFITVMPDDGLEGYYTDWYGRDLDQPSEKVAPGWATFTVHELIPFIDRHYRTIATRRGRAIAGLSMGGFGATSLPARDPGLFSVAGSFSGADDIDYNYPYQNVVLYATNPLFTDAAPDLCIWGDILTDRVHWDAVDPTYLAPNLAHIPLFIATGNGNPGPYDDTSTPSGLATARAAGAVELNINEMDTAFVAALNATHVKHTDYFYGPGTHSFGYWKRDLRHFLPFLARNWKHPRPVPTSFSFRSEAPHFAAWGWSFSVQRTVAEFAYLRSVSKRGLSIAASGAVSITTASDYRPGSRWMVSGKTVTADKHGRLHLRLSLPAHTSQQTSFPAGTAIPAGWTWKRITITAQG